MGRGFGIWRPAKRLIIPSKLKLLILGLQRFASSIATLFMLWGFHFGYLKLKKNYLERLMHFLKMEQNVKFRYYEKATKLEKISHLFWKNSCFYSLASKQVGDFCQIFEAFLKYLLRYSHLFFYQIKSSKKVVKYKQNILEQIIRISRKTLFLISWM